MNQRIASTLGYIGSVAAAVLAAALMSGNALAEGPIEVLPPFAGALSRAEVQAQVMNDRGHVTSYASEWTQQQDRSPRMSGYTRQQARADFIAARDQVHAMTAEDSGSSYVAQMPLPTPTTTVAGSTQR
ncbi:MAG TPA: hypothetical protein VFB71_09795 [Ramlibacter sp.]|nr:hypothetical protein [Ramlibacter sp.]